MRPEVRVLVQERPVHTETVGVRLRQRLRRRLGRAGVHVPAAQLHHRLATVPGPHQLPVHTQVAVLRRQGRLSRRLGRAAGELSDVPGDGPPVQEQPVHTETVAVRLRERLRRQLGRVGGPVQGPVPPVFRVRVPVRQRQVRAGPVAVRPRRRLRRQLGRAQLRRVPVQERHVPVQERPLHRVVLPVRRGPRLPRLQRRDRLPAEVPGRPVLSQVQVRVQDHQAVRVQLRDMRRRGRLRRRFRRGARPLL